MKRTTKVAGAAALATVATLAAVFAARQQRDDESGQLCHADISAQTGRIVEHCLDAPTGQGIEASQG